MFRGIKLKVVMTTAPKVLLAALILIFLFLIPLKAQAGEYLVNRVIDGDTIEVKKGAARLTVRLVGIDAPEVSQAKGQPGQPFSEASTKHLAGWVLNKIVEIKSYGPDRYGRTLAEVVVDTRNINIEMLKAGYAEVYRGDYPVKGLDTKPYWQAEEEARASKRGMWSQRNYISPKKWRANRKD